MNQDSSIGPRAGYEKAMLLREFRERQMGVKGGKAGFTLIELLLVTVILGLLASIAAPYFGEARERAFAAQMQSDLRQVMEAFEYYAVLHDGVYPTSIEQLEDESTYTPTSDVEYCTFVAVPRSPSRAAYIIATTGHPGTTKKLFINYPTWGTQILEYDDGNRGC